MHVSDVQPSNLFRRVALVRIGFTRSVSKSVAKPLSDNYSRPAVSGAMNGARAMHGCAGPGLLSDNPYPARLTPARVWAMTDDKLDIKTYSLSEVAEMVLPSDMTNGIRWISRQRSKPSG